MDGDRERLYQDDRALDRSEMCGFSLLYMEESVAVESCPICRSGRHALYCSNCVKKAKLCEGNRGFKFRSFKEGLVLLKAKTQEKRELEQKISILTQPLYKLDELRWDVELKQRQLAQLREEMDKLTIRIAEKKKSIAERKQQNKRQMRTLSKVRNKMDLMSARIITLDGGISTKQDRLFNVNARVIERRRSIIKGLDQYIFTMELAQNSSVEEDSALCQNIADATSHQFVRGRWSYITAVDKLSCVILGVTIPSSGECTHLKHYLSNSKNASRNATKTLTISDPALAEWAAVGYVSQFAHNISKILDLSLPYATTIPRLNINAMKLSDLMNYLAQLNFNLAFLTSSQGLDTSLYDPSRLLHNLYHLIHYEDLGRREPFTVLTSSLLKSWQGQITLPLTEEQFVDRRYEEDDDWSIVTEIPSIDSSVIESMNSQQAQGLATSARNVVSSFWPF